MQHHVVDMVGLTDSNESPEWDEGKCMIARGQVCRTARCVHHVAMLHHVYKVIARRDVAGPGSRQTWK